MGMTQDLPPLPRFRFPGTGLQLTTGLTSSIEGATCELPNGRGGSPSNTLGTRGTETGSPEISAAWRVLAAQGPMGQERRWAEVEILQLTTGLTSSIGEGATCELPNGRGGSPSNTLGTRGTETGSPELSAAWRVLAAQGPMGQERRWAEEKARRASCQMAEGAVPLTPSERAAQRPAPLSFQRPGGCSQLRGLWARRDVGRRWWKHWTKRDQAKVMVDMGVAGRYTKNICLQYRVQVQLGVDFVA
ncbi:hypothetical protein BJY52DRAFT_1228863 [Lactarius psammicola]|nr:hypothetical protein BJY52DRAFT_1228863 [Lactarius psammicola]